MSDDKFVSHAGDKAAKFPVESRPKAETPKVEVPVAPVEQPTVAVPERAYYCANCRVRKPEKECTLSPLDFRKNADGTVEKIPARYSVFCNVCQKFLAVVDKDAYDELQRMAKVKSPTNKKV